MLYVHCDMSRSVPEALQRLSQIFHRLMHVGLRPLGICANGSGCQVQEEDGWQDWQVQLDQAGEDCCKSCL